MKRRFTIAAAAMGWLALNVVSVNGQGNVMKEARVTQIIKDVKILPPQGESRPATTSDTVRGHTAVRTGVESRAELTFSDLTIARLGANTIFSFNEGTRTVDLADGAILLRVPKGSGGAKIQTAAVTAAITGTTVIAEYHPKSHAKYLVLEGVMRIYLKGVIGESLLLHAGQMIILNPNATRLPEPVDFDLERLMRTSLFIQGFRPIPSFPLIAEDQQKQLELKAAGELIDTNLVIFGRGTLVTMTDPQSSDVIDRKTAAVTLPLPRPTATATSTPGGTPSPTPTASPSTSPTATPTPPPTPSKFGTPPPIVTFVPYPIDNGTAIQTDPAITRAGVTDFGKIYRNTAQDGPFSAWAFTATTPFDNTAGIDVLYGGNVPVAAFKFTSLQLVGDPTISTANGGATNLALISVGPITSAAPTGNTAFTFTGMQSVLIATQSGSIDLSGIPFQNIPLLFFYARGATSTLALGAPISNSQSLRLMAENGIQINAPESLLQGSNGGTLTGISGGTFAVNSSIDTLTGPAARGTFVGSGGTVSLSTSNGAINVDSRIQVSYTAAFPSPISERHSSSGGVIGLNSGLTTGSGISLTSNTSLLSLLDFGAPGPGGSITLTTAGSDIVTNGATIQADRGTITIQQTAAPPVGTSQITLNGGTITSETLLVSSRGDLTVGNTAPVNLSAVSLGFIAARNLSWSGGTLIATASASSGNVAMGSGGSFTIAGPVDIERFNGGITSGLSIFLNAGTTFQANGALHLQTDGSGLTSGANISLTSGAAMTIGGAATLEADTSTADEGSGSNITIRSVGAITAGNFFATVQIGAGRTLSNGGNISLTGNSSFAAPQGDGGIDFQVNNSAPGVIGTGGNISLTLDGNFNPSSSGGLNLLINNQGGQIQTGGNINTTIGGAVTGNFVRVQLDNRSGGFIGNGAGINFAGGTTNLSGFASFTILNSQAGTPGGTIGSDAFIKVLLGDTTLGGSLTAFIDNSNGNIGGTGGSVTLQINGKLSVGTRINVFGTLTSTGTITAGQLSVTNVNAPGIDVGADGITRFNFPSEPFAVPVLHTITTNALTSTGGINFNGPDLTGGFGPFDGGQLTINVGSLTFASSGADIQGPVTFNGGGTNTAAAAGSGGVFNVNATGVISIGSPIQATTGLQPDAAAPSGTGGTVNLISSGGSIGVSAPITVSSADASTGANRRRSAAGGNINLQSNAGTGVAINVTSTGQLLSLLDAAAPGPGGKITILATAADSAINVTGDPGSAGAPPADTIRADRGSVDIRHTGAAGTIALSDAQIAADIVKVGALGNAGTLTIGGGRISADTILKLYAPGPNGSITFIANVSLAGNSTKIIAANTITINDRVQVDIGGKNPAQVFTNRANYTGFGGNGTTTGTFTGAGAQDPQPLANAPPFGPPGGP
jgi:hypothetical protein